MQISYVIHGTHSALIIKSCIFNLLKHARVAEAALKAVPDASVETSGVFFLRTVITGDSESMNAARIAARTEQVL